MALVFLVIFFSTSFGSIQPVDGSISEKITLCPEYFTQCAVLTKDKEGTIISPFSFEILETAKCKAAVPLLTAIPDCAPVYLINFFSKELTKLEPEPDAQLCDSKTNSMFLFSVKSIFVCLSHVHLK